MGLAQNGCPVRIPPATGPSTVGTATAAFGDGSAPAT